MNTGSLRSRVLVTTLSLLVLVLVGVVTAVTLEYRARLQRDLRHQLTSAAGAMRQVWPEGAKQLVSSLALEGIAVDVHTGPGIVPADKAAHGAPLIKAGISTASRGRLLVLSQVLPDGTRITYSASESRIGSAVTRLLEIEVAVSLIALALAALLLLRGTATALRPLGQVARTAHEIAAGDRAQRLRPTRTDTELGSMAAAFDQMVDALDAAAARAENAEKAMRGFLADASHELRTPIAALQASAESLLREQPARPERDGIEANLARSADRLGRLVDDLLGLARLDGHPRLDPLDLNAVVQAAVDEATTRAPSNRVTLNRCEGATVRGNGDALTRVVRNLLDNALTAGPITGTVTVTIRNADQYVEARVTDDGPGIPESERERIFERFVRLNPDAPGNGLGLAIARRIARQHGGDLTCDLANSGGSFTLRLPSQSPNARRIDGAEQAWPRQGSPSICSTVRSSE